MFMIPTIISLFEVVLVLVPALLAVAYVTVAERKTMASMQRRLGPNVVGYYGLLQAFADALKLLLKEYVAPTQANMILFFLGPVITLVFALLGYAVIPYGPGLSINDMNLGIFYLLAVSSIATYGILLAGSPSKAHNHHFHNKCSCKYRTSPCYAGEFLKKLGGGTNAIINITQKRFIHNTNRLDFTNKSFVEESDIKSLHALYISELYKDRIAPVIPFNRESILATCTKFSDKKFRNSFLKEYGSNSGIYIIEYKYDPLIYYIGRTTLFKRRFHNHLKADSGSKLHLFLNLVGWEHFNISIVEICTTSKLGSRENFYLQKYLPILNSVFSSSITEVLINKTLKSKLEDLKLSNYSLSSADTKNRVPLYIYDIDDNGINQYAIYFSSIKEASLALGINPTSLSQYKDTSVPYRNKLVYSNPIEDFDKVFEFSQKNTPQGLLNVVKPVKIWA